MSRCACDLCDILAAMTADSFSRESADRTSPNRSGPAQLQFFLPMGRVGVLEHPEIGINVYVQFFSWRQNRSMK